MIHKKNKPNFLNIKLTIWFTKRTNPTFKILNRQYDSQKRINQLLKCNIGNMKGGWSHPLWQKKKEKIKLASWKRKRKIKKKERKCV